MPFEGTECHGTYECSFRLWTVWIRQQTWRECFGLLWREKELSSSFFTQQAFSPGRRYASTVSQAAESDCWIRLPKQPNQTVESDYWVRRTGIHPAMLPDAFRSSTKPLSEPPCLSSVLNILNFLAKPNQIFCFPFFFLIWAVSLHFESEN